MIVAAPATDAALTKLRRFISWMRNDVVV